MVSKDPFDDLFDCERSRDGRPLLESGLTVGNYRVLERISSQNFSEVYVAEDLTLKRRVALKLLRRVDDSETATMKVRFQREAVVMAQIRHPCTVQLYGLLETPAGTAMVLEFISGGTLESELKKGRLAPREAAEVLLRISEAVASAHALNVIHRDLKPSNVLLEKEFPTSPLMTTIGIIKVVDFGIAFLLGNFESVTITGTQPGTVRYMAPEQVSAQDRITPAVDVFALGSILYEMIVGQPAFSGKTLGETLSQIVDGRPHSLKAMVDEVPDELDQIFLRCHQRSRTERFQNAEELAIALRAFLVRRPGKSSTVVEFILMMLVGMIILMLVRQLLGVR